MGCCEAKPAPPKPTQGPGRTRPFRGQSITRRGDQPPAKANGRSDGAKLPSPRGLGLYTEFQQDQTQSDETTPPGVQRCGACGATTWVSALAYCPRQLKVRVKLAPEQVQEASPRTDGTGTEAQAEEPLLYASMTLAEFWASDKARRRDEIRRRYGGASKADQCGAMIQRWWRRSRILRRWFRVLFLFTYKKLEKWEERKKLQSTGVGGGGFGSDSCPSPIVKASAQRSGNADGDRLAASVLNVSFGAVPQQQWPVNGLAQESEEVKAATVQTLLGLVAAGEIVPIDYVHCLLLEAESCLKELPNVQRCTLSPEARCVVVGDVHGQLVDLLQILREYDLPCASRVYVFNGDWVDRGNKGCEVMVLILTLLVCYSDHVYVNRGNHEDVAMCEAYEFRQEVQSKYDERTFGWFARIFRALPLCTVVEGEVFVCHGGLPRDAVTLADIDSISRFRDVPMVRPRQRQPSGNGSPTAASELGKRIIADLVWSDPIEESQLPRSIPKSLTYLPNGDRGNGVWFRKSHTEQFLRRNGLRLVIRSHEAQDAGFCLAHDSMVVTVFSASYYAGVQRNDGAVAIIALKSDTAGHAALPVGPQKIQGNKCVVEFDTWRVYCEYDFFQEALTDKDVLPAYPQDDASVYPAHEADAATPVFMLDPLEGSGSPLSALGGSSPTTRPIPIAAPNWGPTRESLSEGSQGGFPSGSPTLRPRVLKAEKSLGEIDVLSPLVQPMSVRQLECLLAPSPRGCDTLSPRARVLKRKTTSDEVPSVVREVLSVMHDFVHSHRHRLMSVFSSSEASRTGLISPQEWAHAMREVSGCQEVPWGFVRPWLAEELPATESAATTVCYPMFVRRFAVPLEDRLFRKWAPSLVKWLWTRAKAQHATPKAVFDSASGSHHNINYQRFFHWVTTDLQTHLPSDIIFAMFTHFDKSGAPGYLREQAWTQAFDASMGVGVHCDQYEEDLDGLMTDWVVSPNTYFVWDYWLAQRLRALIKKCITPKAAFDLLDVDKDGVLSLPDLRHTLTRLGSNKLQHPARQIVYKFTVERASQVTEEDIALVSLLYGEPKDTIRAGLEEVGGGQPVQVTLYVWPLTDSQMKCFLGSIDYDGDGTVNYADFLRAFFVVDLHPHSQWTSTIESPLSPTASSRLLGSAGVQTPPLNCIGTPNKAFALAFRSFRRMRQRSGMEEPENDSLGDIAGVRLTRVDSQE
eukprot:TRINITY_DN16827_c0_g2_i2.p1 TRINITY_DN16827_c0_g2~~TRINITY_DN16827_c0_g2_i2.p1  ORF type:complete len:1200 (+),score=315.01 TRINITY_DN16827_c0_g2_i2:60-3659(+)